MGVEVARLSIKDLVRGAINGDRVGDTVVEVNGVLFQVDVVFVGKVVGEEVQGGFTEVVDSLLEAFVALTVF